MEGGRHPFFGGFGHPFGSFGGSGDPFGSSGGSGNPFGSLGGFGGFGGQRSLMSGFFGGRDPFDDPFFASPFGNMFEPSLFGSNGGPFMNPNISEFIEHQPAQPNTSRGPVIEELNSDDEVDEEKSGNVTKENPRKHGRSCKEPSVEDPDEEATEKKSKLIPRQNEIYQMHNARSQPQTHSFTFQSSTVSYGGANGAYYTSSKTRRSGSDGLTFEECKEADSSTRQATHRVSRGIHEKGHSVTRKLKADGHVDTSQILHNLNEDELTGFEEAWGRNARNHLPGLGEGFASQVATGSRNTGRHRALPSAERSSNHGRSLRLEAGGTDGAPQHSERGKGAVNDGHPLRIRSNGGGSSSQANRR